MCLTLAGMCSPHFLDFLRQEGWSLCRHAIVSDLFAVEIYASTYLNNLLLKGRLIIFICFWVSDCSLKNLNDDSVSYYLIIPRLFSIFRLLILFISIKISPVHSYKKLYSKLNKYSVQIYEENSSVYLH